LIGHATGGFGKLLDISVPWEEDAHAIDHFLEVLNPLGIAAPAGLRGSIYSTAEDELYVQTICNTHNLKEFVIVHPFAGELKKIMPPELWLKLIQDATLPIVLCGNEGEKFSNEKCINLIGLLSIQQMFLLFQQASHIYALDSLAGHLAALSKTPTQIFYKRHLFSKQWTPLWGEVELSVLE
jgi:ADP-heptose:LPS heptosyltransferase